MKTFLAVILFTSFSSSLTAQTNFNTISSVQFSNIAFDENTLDELMILNGNVEELEAKFDIDFKETANDPTGEARTFESSLIQLDYFGFGANNSLSNVTVFSNQILISIMGEIINIGSSIRPLSEKFSDFESIDYDNNENLRIAIFKPVKNDSYLMIYFNATSNNIKGVYFINPT